VPLSGSDRETISENIRREVRTARPVKQAAAIAYRKAREGDGKMAKQGKPRRVAVPGDNDYMGGSTTVAGRQYEREENAFARERGIQIPFPRAASEERSPARTEGRRRRRATHYGPHVAPKTPGGNKLALIQAGSFIVGAAAGPRLDALIPFRPMGFAPSVYAIPVAIAGGMIAKRYGYKKSAKAATALAVGLTAGAIVRGIAAQRA
jgi:hypothetical protein